MCETGCRARPNLTSRYWNKQTPVEKTKRVSLRHWKRQDHIPTRELLLMIPQDSRLSRYKTDPSRACRIERRSERKLKGQVTSRRLARMKMGDRSDLTALQGTPTSKICKTPGHRLRGSSFVPTPLPKEIRGFHAVSTCTVPHQFLTSVADDHGIHDSAEDVLHSAHDRETDETGDYADYIRVC